MALSVVLLCQRSRILEWRVYFNRCSLHFEVQWTVSVVNNLDPFRLWDKLRVQVWAVHLHQSHEPRCRRLQGQSYQSQTCADFGPLFCTRLEGSCVSRRYHPVKYFGFLFEWRTLAFGSGFMKSASSPRGITSGTKSSGGNFKCKTVYTFAYNQENLPAGNDVE
jgi:hypothetical protein